MDTRIDMFDPLANPRVEAMVAAWQRGERPTAEEFLVPEIDDEIAIRLIFEEFCLRQEAGLTVDPRDFAARFPRWWPELELLLDCQRLMEAAPTSTARLPGEGDELGGFHLIRELGRGVLGKVFLATEAALADRPVVVKVAPLGRGEHLSLARLQHMNIVPLYSAQRLPQRSLQVFCMPFLGGASLAQVLDLLRGVEPSRRTGSQLIEALDQIQRGLPARVEVRGPFRRQLARSSYVDAIAWIGLCLAEGLRSAHERDFVHMDIKPSNILIAGDGQPMLLDFHLAREPIAAGEPPPTELGGTPGYMAPEQAEALVSVVEGRPTTTRVDGRADLYALGAVLDEALGGARSASGVRVSLTRRNPRVSIGLADLVARCLQPDPAARYPDAESLAADLRRFLDGQPLRGVPNRSLAERWRNWRRRSPQGLPRLMVLVVAVVVACSALGLLRAIYLQRVREVESALHDGLTDLDRRQYAEAARVLKRGQALAKALPGAVSYDPATWVPLLDGLDKGLALARCRSKADELHRLAELVRFRYGIDPPPPAEARVMIDRGREIWRGREQLRDPLGQLDPNVRADLLDFTLAWVNLSVRMAQESEQERTLDEGLRVLDDAETLLGPSSAIDRERRTILGRGNDSAAFTAPPRSARDHFDLGVSLIRAGDFATAADQFRLGLVLRPQDFWLNFYQGLTAYRLERFDESANAFRVAIALAPESAECYYNRALALGALGQIDAAILDDTRALEINPALGVAALNRGILRFQSKRFAEASDDLNQALTLVSSRAEQALICYNLGLVELARGDRSAAITHLDRAVELGHQPARAIRDRLEAELKTSQGGEVRRAAAGLLDLGLEKPRATRRSSTV